MSSRPEIDLNLPATESPTKGMKLDLDLNVPAMPEEDEEPSSPTKEEDPPKYPIVICVVCQEEVVEETTTSCGHIFCKGCIKAALKTNRKCPTCQRKQCIKDLRRLDLSFNRL